jgi:hypothetical protein
MLLFSFEFWPRQAVVDWANRIAAQPKYADYTAALVTHSYLNWNNQRMNEDGSSYGVGAGGDFNTGEDLWQELVRLNPNFEMTFSGHVGGDGVGYLKSTGTGGNVVHQMMINAQFETNGGNGWMRVLEFLKDGKTVRVRTYSPFLDLYRTDPTNDFEIVLSQLPMTTGDFNADGAVDLEDLAAWIAGNGAASGANRIDGDADGDGDVDGADYPAWQQNLGAAAQAAGATVPEPAALLLALPLAALAWARRRR